MRKMTMMMGWGKQNQRSQKRKHLTGGDGGLMVFLFTLKVNFFHLQLGHL